jgi:hypothetical protein
MKQCKLCQANIQNSTYIKYKTCAKCRKTNPINCQSVLLLPDEKNSLYIKENIPIELRSKVWDIHSLGQSTMECFVCCKVIHAASSDYHCSHIVAASKGGKMRIDNLVPTCKRCNTSMGTKNLYDYRHLFTSDIKEVELYNDLWKSIKNSYESHKKVMPYKIFAVLIYLNLVKDCDRKVFLNEYFSQYFIRRISTPNILELIEKVRIIDVKLSLHYIDYIGWRNHIDEHFQYIQDNTTDFLNIKETLHISHLIYLINSSKTVNELTNSIIWLIDMFHRLSDVYMNNKSKITLEYIFATTKLAIGLHGIITKNKGLVEMISLDEREFIANNLNFDVDDYIQDYFNYYMSGTKSELYKINNMHIEVFYACIIEGGETLFSKDELIEELNNIKQHNE